jgi:hypothetical protein
MTDKKAVNEDGEASDLNNELDLLLEMAQDYLSSQKEGRFAPCNPDFLIKNLVVAAKRYAWLRATTNWASCEGERIDVSMNPKLWDEAIDACIAEAE